MVELVDTPALGAGAYGVRVRVPPSAQKNTLKYEYFLFFSLLLTKKADYDNIICSFQFGVKVLVLLFFSFAEVFLVVKKQSRYLEGN